MKKVLSKWQIAGFIFTGIAGVLLHFLFEWTGENPFVAAFSAVNESTWEHMKILFFPMFVFAIAESRYIGKDYKNFWCAKLLGILLGLVLIPVLFYTLGGVFGILPDWVNIAIFFIAAAAGFYVETRLMENGMVNCGQRGTGLLILCVIALAFVVFTFSPPEIPLFLDPVSNNYGY